ncbi:NfeD family protein [Granulosicoccus antarcticus]|uniref:Inner membrane protein YbbJ n=1 Tax=Granulosicoccus antarcticus IMCC3135 TaxID=1192854 RepID=A0A2Z2P3P2_9GAMM|nr:NfeD family protein [Granulosicoccus antarcticus]ASJ74424.1 Inner membrane protein YbbJ [Granulosicoccus antarcticus IMCC3135]
MDTLFTNQATLWLTIGFALLAIEAVAFGFTSGLLLFGSLGAILTGALLWLAIVPNTFIAAVACFAISTALITVILWRPLKRLQSGAELGHDRSSDLIGHSFILSSDIDNEQSGNQKYSGINWRVEPAEELADKSIAAGTRVCVTAVSVGVFFVQPTEQA